MKCPQCNAEIPHALAQAEAARIMRAGRVGSLKVAEACRRNVLKRWAARKAQQPKDGGAT